MRSCRQHHGCHAGYTRIVDDDIDFSESIQDAADTCIHALLITNVHRHCEGPFPAENPDGRTRAQCNARALIMELKGDRAADASARAGYNGNLVYGHKREGSINHGIGKTGWP